MSRHESDFTIAEEAAFSAAELLGPKARRAGLSDRDEAIVRYLAASDGWEEALEQLGGAFAPTATAKEG